MMDGMDEKSLKLKSLMDLINDMKMEESKDLPGKPKMAALEIKAMKLPGKPMQGEMEVESPDHEAMEMPEDMKSESADHESMESPGFEHAEDEAGAELMSKLPPELQDLIREHLRKGM